MKNKITINRICRPTREKDKEDKASKKNMSFFSLFKFATCYDIISILIGVGVSSFAGCITPITSMMFGEVTGSFIDFQIVINSEYQNNTVLIRLAEDKMMNTALKFLTYNLSLGVAVVVLSYIGVLLISWPANRQISRIRYLYMESLLNKDISWYDTNQTGDFSSRIIEDITKVEEAIGDKIATFTFYISVFIAGTIVGLVKGWQLAVICLVYLPVSTLGMSIVSWLSNKLVNHEIEAYATAASTAEEVLGSIRTVVAFDGQEKEIARYDKSLAVAKYNNIRKGLFAGINQMFTWFFIFCSYALSFYYGIKFIIAERSLPEEERVYTSQNMLTVFYNILVATWNFGHTAPYFQIFATAQAAATKVFSIIDERPVINASKGTGYSPKNLKGNISFKNVYFHYPSRPEVKILNGLTLEIKKGETVALVGNSGCGKSTVIQLIQRFYDVLPSDYRTTSQVAIDNIDIKEYDLSWLRSMIGVVGQEPVLFATTIAENILYGNKSATYQDIIKVAKKANAHNFIEHLPNGYNTLVGERGTQLSGGQKQRIAIARALIRNPTILLLDEATSALDTHSEALVQEALDNASKECTTIIVAHRLSTIRGADRILVIHEGQVIEDGKHEILMEKKGAYYKLVTAQMNDKEEESIQEKQNEQGNKNKEDVTEVAPQEVVATTKMTVDEKPDMGVPTLIWSILKLNRPELPLIIFGTLFAFIQGTAMPAFAVVFGSVLGAISSTDDDYLASQRDKYCLYFAFIGVGSAVSAFAQTYLLCISGEKLTLRVRSRMFETMLKQEVSWFDDPERGVGALCTSLSSDACGLQGASGQPIGTALTSLSSLGFALCISFYFEWRITLVAMTFIPLIFISIYFESIIGRGSRDKDKQFSIEDSAKYAIEAISNIRTVASLGIEGTFHLKYLELLEPHHKKARIRAHIRGIVFAVSRALIFFIYAAIIYYGATLIRDEHLNYDLIYKVFQAILNGTWAVSTSVAFTPNLQKGLVSANKVFKLLAREPEITDGSDNGSLVTRTTDINYDNIYFSYPTRKEAKILKGLDLSIHHGKTIALVGPSGCGKSTIIQLLERFYDPVEGFVKLADHNIKHMKLSTLRSHLGIVSQEPTLFDRTIAENIAYGDNSRDVPMEEIVQAAKNANIHNFITGLPSGYDTRLGEKGTQLSGGQKQRIAIARALVRDPSILLLDEATSALDTESEKIVQEALDKARNGRTCITIAHRLVTIQDADVICVIDKGIVAEMGTHSQLLGQRGLYHKLYNKQMGRK